MLMMQIDLLKVRQNVKDGKYLIKTHARQRMAERGIHESEVMKVLLKGRIIEETPDAKPYPKCLIMHFIRKDEPLYVSCATEGERVFIITVHWYDPNKWVDPWTRRR
jgi:hypothetical protein